MMMRRWRLACLAPSSFPSCSSISGSRYHTIHPHHLHTQLIVVVSALKFCRPLSTWLEASAWTQRGTFPPSFSPCFLTLPTSNPLQEQRRQPLLQQRQHHRHGFDRGPKRPARPKEQQGAGAAPELICLDLHDRKRPRARPPARYAWKTYACVLRLKAYGRYRDNLRDGVVALRP